MSKHTYFKLLILLIFSLLSLSCSDSKPDKLISSFTDDFNNNSVLITNRVSQKNVYANYDNGEIQNITDTLLWSSSDETLATVSNGLITTYSAVGSVSIEYETVEKDKNGIPLYKNSVLMDVKDLSLTGITLSQTSLSLSVGTTRSIVAQGTFEDNVTSFVTTEDITQDCNWSSADLNVSSVTNGTIRGIQEGNTSIMARDSKGSDINATLAVEVTKIKYLRIYISTKNTEFNVQQSIELEARADTSDGKIILLKNSDVDWLSSSTNVSMSDNIATAISKGNTTISVTLKEDKTLSDTQSLTVQKDAYLRLFKNGVEVEYPYVASEINATLSTTLDTFTLRAVGVDFIINDLAIKNFDEVDISSGFTYFNDLSVGAQLSADKNVSFTLERGSLQTQLHYYFDINDSTRSSFSQKYEQKD